MSFINVMLHISSEGKRSPHVKHPIQSSLNLQQHFPHCQDAIFLTCFLKFQGDVAINELTFQKKNHV